MPGSEHPVPQIPCITAVEGRHREGLQGAWPNQCRARARHSSPGGAALVLLLLLLLLSPPPVQLPQVESPASRCRCDEQHAGPARALEQAAPAVGVGHGKVQPLRATACCAEPPSAWPLAAGAQPAGLKRQRPPLPTVSAAGCARWQRKLSPMLDAMDCCEARCPAARRLEHWPAAAQPPQRSVQACPAHTARGSASPPFLSTVDAAHACALRMQHGSNPVGLSHACLDPRQCCAECLLGPRAALATLCRHYSIRCSSQQRIRRLAARGAAGLQPTACAGLRGPAPACAAPPWQGRGQGGGS